MKALNERNIIFEVQVKQIKTKVVNEKIQIDCRDRYVSKYTVLKIKFTDLKYRQLQLIVTGLIVIYCVVKPNGLSI